MSKSNAPGLSTGKRSPSFQRYLDEQTPERRAEILGEESKFLSAREIPGGGSDAAERDFTESMRGFEDTPAGGGRGV